MIIFALEQSLSIVEEGNSTWSTKITEKCVLAANAIIDYCIQQKIIMMDIAEVADSSVPSIPSIQYAARLKKFILLSSEDEAGTISPSNVTRGHISECVLGKYKVEKAFELFDTADGYGLGKVIDTVTPTKRKVKKFKKKPYDLLSTEARQVLREIRVTEEEYRSSFTVLPLANKENELK